MPMQLIANIIVLAAIYALLGAGYVMIYRVSRVLNLAHGELMMLAAYLLLAVAALFSATPVLAVAVAAGLALAVGLLVYLLLMRWMTGEAVLAAVLATIALGILLRGAVILGWSADVFYPATLLGYKNPPVALPGGARISTAALVLVVTTALVYVGLHLFLRHTPFGIRMRAAGQNPLLAAQRGIRLHGVYALAWGISTFTGGLVGMLLALDSGVDSGMAVIGLKAFPAALVGGLDSLPGALAGALIVATAEVTLIQYVDPLLSDVVPFFVLLAVLAVRPWGLFGSREQLDRV
jgi:branched-chain amino acid transport system permease protein